MSTPNLITSSLRLIRLPNLVTPREPPQPYRGMELSIRPLDPKTKFILTGDRPEFKLIVHNTTENRIHGKILYYLKWSKNKTINAVKIDVEPHKTEEYTLNREWLGDQDSYQYGICELHNSPEEYESYSDNSLEKEYREGMSVHPLCSFVVTDKEIVKSQRKMARATIILLGIAAVCALILLVKAFY